MKNLISIIFFIIFSLMTVMGQELTGNLSGDDLKQVNAEVIKLYQQKRFDEASSLAIKAIDISNQVYGKNHLETAKALRNLGYIYFAQKDREKAENIFKDALKIYENIPNLNENDSANLAEMLEILGFIKSQNNSQDTEKYYRLALNWREKSHGKNSPKNLSALMALAKTNFENKAYEESAELYLRVLEISSVDEEAKIKYFDLSFFRCECALLKADKKREFEDVEKKYLSKTNVIFPKDSTEQNKNANDSEIINGKALFLGKPRYPKIAIGGKSIVEVKVLIDETGNVISACAMRIANMYLIEPAEEAAYQSKFAPISFKGKPIKVSGSIVFKFF